MSKHGMTKEKDELHFPFVVVSYPVLSGSDKENFRRCYVFIPDSPVGNTYGDLRRNYRRLIVCEV